MRAITSPGEKSLTNGGRKKEKKENTKLNARNRINKITNEDVIGRGKRKINTLFHLFVNRRGCYCVQSKFSTLFRRLLIWEAWIPWHDRVLQPILPCSLLISLKSKFIAPLKLLILIPICSTTTSILHVHPSYISISDLAV